MLSSPGHSVGYQKCVRRDNMSHAICENMLEKYGLVSQGLIAKAYAYSKLD